jgi:hypothetical protein
MEKEAWSRKETEDGPTQIMTDKRCFKEGQHGKQSIHDTETRPVARGGDDTVRDDVEESMSM